ncbi:Ger(x)C family spore germination protein [Cytobacillus sp. FJAT-54145]|uniref:Ger(X)C family spore germination protein n=1 Tax=Cytobacillus spartinae TaxID=3299023 RepID=A0ABW6KA51_9BACI
MKNFEYGDKYITEKEIAYAVPSMVIGVGILTLPRLLATTTKTDGYIALLVAGGLSIIITWLIAALPSRFPGQSFYSYTGRIATKPVALLLTIGISLYFLALTSYLIRVVSMVAKQYLFDITPLEVIAFLFLLIIIYGGAGGSIGVLRLNLMFVPIILLISFTVVLFNIGLMEFQNLYPFLKSDLKSYFVGIKDSHFAFAGTGILLFYISLVKQPIKVPKYAGLSMVIPTILYLIIHLSCILVFSYSVTGTLLYPTIELAKEVQIPGGFFERFESIFFTVWIMAIFNTTLMAFDISILALSSVVTSWSRMTWIYILSPIAFVMAMLPQNFNAVSLFGNFLSYVGMGLTQAIPILLLVTGCWDRVEIEERGFVVGMAIDLIENENKDGTDQYEVTFQYVIPAGFGYTQGGGAQEAFKNVTETGESLHEIGKELAIEVSRSPYYEHLQLVVISEDVAKSEGALENILDFLIRDHEMRRSTKVVISKGEPAIKILETEPKVEKLPTMYIDSILENHFKTAKLLMPTVVGDLHENLLQENNFVIPSIRTKDDLIKVDGGAVFKGLSNKLIGFIDENEVMGLNFIVSEVKGGTIKTNYKNSLVVYEIERADSKVEPIVKSEDNVEFTIKIKTEGKIVQSFKPVDFLNQKEIDQIEKALEKSLESTVKNTIERTQKEIKVDILGLNRILEHKRYDSWQKMKKHWDKGEGTFPTAKINIDTNVIIRTTGTSTKTTN